MNTFKIDEDRLSYFQKQIDQIVAGLQKLSDAADFRALLTDLENFRDGLAKTMQFDEAHYNDLSKNIIVALKAKGLDKATLQGIWSLSSIEPDLREIYEELDVLEGLFALVSENQVETTGSNYVLMTDYQYSYYYHKFQRLIEESGVAAVIDYMNTDPNLLKNKGRGWMMRSAFINFADFGIVNEEELALVKQSVDCEELQKVKWR